MTTSRTARYLSSWRLVRPLIVGAAFLILSAAIGFFAVRYWQQRELASVWVEHGRQVLETLDRLRSNFADLEAERRGYLLTLDPEYLKPYGVSDESIRREAEALQILVAGDPVQSLRASHLTLTVSAKLREMDDIFKTARTSGRDAALAIISNMDEIRTQIDQMVDHERFLLANWETRIAALEESKTTIIAVTAGIVVSLAGAALALARLEARRRRKATEENVQLQSDLKERDIRIRRLFDANIIGILIFDLEERIIDANDAFLNMVGYTREDLAAGRMRWTDMTPDDWRSASEQRLAELKVSATCQAYEKEYFRKDGGRVPILVGAAMFEGRGGEGVAFVLDLTERKRAEEALRESEQRYRETFMELTHANRIATMGQLTASIAHEVNQPIAGVVINANAALRWLGAQPPELEEVRQALARIDRDGKRAGDVISRIRALVTKAPQRTDKVAINEAILAVIALAQGEVVKNGVSVQTELADGLPSIEGDGVQLQQVILNLIVNAVEAMSTADEGSRKLRISTELDASGRVLVAVRDSGPGLDAASQGRIFEAFYTTKPSGIGMGLAISRSIIEAHGGRIWVTANIPNGVAFYFSLPSPATQGERAGVRARENTASA